MGTLYRSIWAAGSTDAVRTVDEAVVGWARAVAKDGHRPLEDGPGPLWRSARDRYVLRRDVHDGEGDTKIDHAVRIDLTSTRGQEVWRTSARAWSGGSLAAEDGVPAWVWVDVEAVSAEAESAGDLVAEPPPFLAELLHRTRATRAGVELSAMTRHLVGAEGAGELAELLTQFDRDMPVVVFGLPGGDTDEHLAREAASTASAVAGLAVVRTIDRAGLGELADILGDGAHGVTPGAMKLYLPSLDPASGPDERHVEVASERVARPGLSAALAVRSLERQAVCRRAPRSWDQARRRLEDSAPGSELIVYIQARSADRVRELERDLETERSESEYYLEEATELEQQVNALQAELADARARVHALRHGLDEPEHPVLDPGLLVRDCSGAVALARDQLSEFLTVLDSALRGLPDLDAQGEAGSWGRKAWRAFRALAAYAEDRRAGVGGDFQQWCASTDRVENIAASAVAMGESATTVSRWGEQRVFDVDGQPVSMLAHIRVGGRRVAPRIHFDWDETTGRVRVGYFGRHLRNTRT